MLPQVEEIHPEAARQHFKKRHIVRHVEVSLTQYGGGANTLDSDSDPFSLEVSEDNEIEDESLGEEQELMQLRFDGEEDEEEGLTWVLSGKRDISGSGLNDNRVASPCLQSLALHSITMLQIVAGLATPYTTWMKRTNSKLAAFWQLLVQPLLPE